MAIRQIKLDDNYVIESDGRGCVLKFQKSEEVTDLDTFETKTVTKKDKWYLLNIRQALKVYVDEVLETSEDISQLIERLDELEKVIQNIK